MKFYIYLLLSVFFFLTFFASGYVDSQDGLQYLTVARRFYYDGTFEMPEESFDENGANIHMSDIEGIDGKIFSVTGLGYSLSLLPAVVFEDFFLNVTNVEPITAFPLQHDWPVLLFASMTNAFWGAVLVVGMVQYFEVLKIDRKRAIFLTLLLFISSNLFVYAKHTFAQMMFTAALFHTFLQVKVFSLSDEKKHLMYAGLWYGIVVISYNLTYTFPIIPLGLFYVVSTKKDLSLQSVKKICVEGVVGLLGLLPFLGLYKWFNTVRFGSHFADSVSSGVTQSLSLPPAYVIVEGFWGLLFSPGKSIFLFTPVLIVLVLFWFKLKRQLLPEIIAAASLFLIYLWFIGTLLGGEDFLVWHGDSSWGPRYLLPTLPLFLILCGFILTQLSVWQKRLVVYPLLISGLLISILGTILPYQTRFSGLAIEGFINGRSFNVYEYGNEIPRYSPPFLQLKRTVRRLKELSRLHNRGEYNLRFKDGYEYPFDLGFTVWRGMRSLAVLELEQSQPITDIQMTIKNHQLKTESSQSAFLDFSVNKTRVFDEPITLLPEEIKDITIPIDFLTDQINTITVASVYESSSAAELKKKQILFLQNMEINGVQQNLHTIEVPYVSAISNNLQDQQYQYWGNVQKDPWDIWHHHSGVFERTFDFWWLRPLYYWDLPKDIFVKMLSINAILLILFSTVCWRQLKK